MRFHRPFCLVLASLLFGSPAAPGEEQALESDRDMAFYVIGTMVGRGLKGLDLNPEEFSRVADGIRDAALSREIRASPFEHYDAIKALQDERRQRANDNENRRNQDYLDNIARRAGAVRTESGLVFTALASGTGPTPGPRDRVKVHYEGHLRSGEVFDSTRLRDTAAVFPLEAVIPCWAEGLQLMRVGGRARIVCPAAIAYGSLGYPPSVPPNSLLDFEVELIEIEPKS